MMLEVTTLERLCPKWKSFTLQGHRQRQVTGGIRIVGIQVKYTLFSEK